MKSIIKIYGSGIFPFPKLKFQDNAKLKLTLATDSRPIYLVNKRLARDHVTDTFSHQNPG